MVNQRQQPWRKIARRAPWEIWIYAGVLLSSSILPPLLLAPRWTNGDYAIHIGSLHIVSLVLEGLLLWFLIRGSLVAWWITVLVTWPALAFIFLNRDDWWVGWAAVTVVELAVLECAPPDGHGFS